MSFVRLVSEIIITNFMPYLRTKFISKELNKTTMESFLINFIKNKIRIFFILNYIIFLKK